EESDEASKKKNKEQQSRSAGLKARTSSKEGRLRKGYEQYIAMEQKKHENKPGNQGMTKGREHNEELEADVEKIVERALRKLMKVQNEENQQEEEEEEEEEQEDEEISKERETKHKELWDKIGKRYTQDQTNMETYGPIGGNADCYRDQGPNTEIRFNSTNKPVGTPQLPPSKRKGRQGVVPWTRQSNNFASVYYYPATMRGSRRGRRENNDHNGGKKVEDVGEAQHGGSVAMGKRSRGYRKS
ncbi:MAG: hypothetical protein Q9170_007546, partial [Blastenia crenularia]